MENNKKVICQDRDGNKKEFRAEDLTLRPSVYGILIENNKILLNTSWDGNDLPGGAIEKHETLKEALKREFFEETGVVVKVGRVVNVANSFFIMPSSGKPINGVLIFYLCEKIEEKGFKKENLDINEKEYMKPPKWVDLDKIDNVKFHCSIDLVEVLKKAMKII